MPLSLRASLLLAVLLAGTGAQLRAEDFEIVLENGRVMDPASGLDAIRNVGLRGGAIAAISEEPLHGRIVVDARGCVVAPGFIDLHQHAHEPADYALKAQDGVTTVCELEVGTGNVDAWYARHEGKSLINFGVSVGHIACRTQVLGGRPEWVPAADAPAANQVANEAQLAEICRLLDAGLQRGAIAVGIGIAYTPRASSWEILEVFRVAARYHASCHVHVRAKGDSGPENIFASIEEVIAASAATGAPLQVCHVQSSSNRFTPRVLELIGGARERGLDISVECYPYDAGMGEIRSAGFNPGWQERYGGLTYQDLEWPLTGERLTAESFARYRAIGGNVISHSNTEETVRAAVASPLTLIASDGLRGHPRNAGTCARVLGRYVREAQVLPLMSALAKLSLMPARRLEQRVPAMRRKGRISVGADADVVVFDPAAVIDRATYAEPNLPSVGMRQVLVGGVFVVRDGVLQSGVQPGQAVRAPIASH